jgi:hypothetical protein
VEEFALDTRRETMEKQAKRIQETRVKVEAYADLLKDKVDDLYKTIDDARAVLATKVSAASLNPTAPAAGKGYRIMGYDACAVLRRLGKLGWTFKETLPVVVQFPGCDQMAENTLRCQLHGGKTGTRGEPADLTAEEVRKLEEMRKEVQNG